MVMMQIQYQQQILGREEVDSRWGHSNTWGGRGIPLLSDILEYTSTNHQLEFIEVLFNTISHHKKYNLYRPRQFQTIQFHDKGHINCKDVLTTHSDMWYHPIKTQTKFYKFLSDYKVLDS